LNKITLSLTILILTIKIVESVAMTPTLVTKALIISDCQIPDSGIDIGLSKEISIQELVDMKQKVLNGELQEANALYSYLRDDYSDMAICWLKLAANENNAYAQNTLAENYLIGQYLEKDINKAIYWYEQAAQGKESYDYSKISLGDIYSNGQYIAKNDKKAMFWYTKATQGDKESPTYGNALYKVAYANQYGVGVAKNEDKALEIYNEILDLPLNIARDDVKYLANANMYETGLGVRKDIKEAADYYFYAAIDGDKSAQFKMNELYREGKGVPQDSDMANGWLEISQLTPEQLSVSIYE
jgi:TPR repeat protein